MPSSLIAPIVGSVAGAAAGKLLGGGKGGGGGSTTVQQKEMPGWLSQDWQDLVTQAQGVNQQPFAPYTGQAVAPLSGDESTAFQSLRDLMGSSDAAFGGAQSTLQDVIGRAVNGPSAGQIQGLMNPYTQNVLEQQNLMTLQNYDRTMGGLKSQAVNAGGFGGSGDYISRAMASKDLGQQLSMNNATGLSNAFSQAMGQWNQNTGTMANTAMQKAGLASNLQNLDTSGANALANAGATQRGIQQQGNAFDYSEFMRQQNYPKDQANFLSNILGQATPGFSGTTTQLQNNPNQLNSILGGATTGMSLGNSIQNYGQQQGWFGGGSSYNPTYGSGGGGSSYSNNMGWIDWAAKEGGLVPGYAKGGIVKGYDSGGLIQMINNLQGVNSPSGMYPSGHVNPLSPSGMSGSGPSMLDYILHAIKSKGTGDIADQMDPVAAHRRAVMDQEAGLGFNSDGQREDLKNPALSLPSDTSGPMDYSLGNDEDLAKQWAEPIDSNALSVAAATPPQAIGTQDSSSMLNDLINKTIKDKITESNRPKTFAEEANTPLLAMGLSMMGSNNPSFGGALNEGYKAFQGATTAEESRKDKQLKDLLDLAETQRKNTSQGIEDQLRQAQTKEALAKAGNNGFKPLSPNQKLASYTRFLAPKMSAIDKQLSNGMLSPTEAETAREGARKEADKDYSTAMTRLGFDPVPPGKEGVTEAPGLEVENPVIAKARAAIAGGAPREAVIQRLKAANIDTSGL